MAKQPNLESSSRQRKDRQSGQSGTRSPQSERSDTSSGGSSPPGRMEKNPQATRETVESVVVAIILAFLFRAFIAEAFVIPTGSMAPTLYGRNKDVTCSQCGYKYAAGASSEVDRPHQIGSPVIATHCPICRVQMGLNPGENRNHYSFSGDRILVSKFAYALGSPKRWDVIVFKYPGNAKQNYIKRLIGLPNEAVMIFNGNILTAKRIFHVDGPEAFGPDAVQQLFASNGVTLSPEFQVVEITRSSSSSLLVVDGKRTYAMIRNRTDDRTSVYGDTFEVQRKPPHKLVAMLQIVDDSNFIGETLQSVNWPSRWQDWSGRETWDQDSEGVFATRGDSEGTAWLRYRHLAPTPDDWRRIEQGRAPADIESSRGSLILDYYAYNEAVNVNGNLAEPVHWVGDLAVECNVEIEGNAGALSLDLVEGGGHYQCRIDVATGDATLSIKRGEEGFSDPGDEAVIPTVVGASGVTGPGDYKLRFANVDDQLTLWVDDRIIKFKGPTTYRTRANVVPQWSLADAGDAEPIGIGSDGLAMKVDHVRVLRDIYYVANDADQGEYGVGHAIENLLSSPERWSETNFFEKRMPALFGLESDQFFPLGDNSPASSDARMWAGGGDEWYVNRQLLIGKAVLIYWPHYWNAPIPFFPNFGRMRLIR